jgi:hypothetical protein
VSRKLENRPVIVSLLILGMVVNMGRSADTSIFAVLRVVEKNIPNQSMSDFVPLPSHNLCNLRSGISEGHLNDVSTRLGSHQGDIVLPVLSTCSSGKCGLEPNFVDMNSKIYDNVPKAKVTKHIGKWAEELVGDFDQSYLIAGLSEGFDIVDEKKVPKSCFRKNYNSTAGENYLKVENRLKFEINEGRYIRTPVRPTVISSLGAIPKDLDDIRLIHDLSRPDGGVNAMATDTSVRYTTIDDVTQHIDQHCD